ncbi:MAG: GNAT family N-acetyltransferase [Thermoproteota archaeon]|nr:GNAT family N-acetyltransferase [Thermoproteota archaeon]
MNVIIKNIRKENVRNIPKPCKSCLYWEFPEDFEAAQKKSLELKEKIEFAAKKAAWFLQTQKNFGNCGKIVYFNNIPVGYAQYAPSNMLPQVESYGSNRIGRREDGVVFLSCLFIANKEFRRKGLGTKLLNSVIADLNRRGFKAVETFARREIANNPSGPLKFYLNNGFHVKDETNPDFPLVRLDF